jgi:hypothetical protein
MTTQVAEFPQIRMRLSVGSGPVLTAVATMTESEVPPTPAPAKADSTSLGDLLGEVTRDISTLMREEMELAKAELNQATTRAAKGAAMLGGAGVGRTGKREDQTAHNLSVGRFTARQISAI